MGLIKEPKGVDFIIQSRPLTEEEQIEISEFIQSKKQNKTMEILIYDRLVETYHIHHTVSTNMIYIPSMEKILYKESSGTFSDWVYGITDNKELLEESKLVYEGNQPVIDRLEISNIRKVEVLDSFIDMAIEDAIKSKELIEKTKLNIESLIELK